MDTRPQYEIDLEAFKAAEAAGALPIEVLAWRQRQAAKTYGWIAESYTRIYPPAPKKRYDTVDGLPAGLLTPPRRRRLKK